MRIAIIPIALCLILGMALTGCGDDKQSVADNKGNQLVLEDFEVTENGFYVLNERDKTFTPLMTNFEEGGDTIGDEFGGMVNDVMAGTAAYESGEAPHLWLGDENYDPGKLIPTVDGRNNKLVMWYDGTDEMPEEFTLSRCRRLGYTIGVHVSFGNTAASIFLVNEDMCPGSDAYKKLSFSGDMCKITRINGSKKLPYRNIDTDVNMLLGLDKNKVYKIGYFDGTQYYKETIEADVLAFKIMDIQTLETPYSETEKDYFYVNLPNNLKNGYYYLNGVGLFKYIGEKKYGN